MNSLIRLTSAQVSLCGSFSSSAEKYLKGERSVLSKSTSRSMAAILVSAAFACHAASPQEQLPPNAQIGDYIGSDVMLPMRDGIKLHAEVWRPKGDSSKLPILMQRSPYGFGAERVKRSMGAEYKELAQEHFIFVLEDIRGRFGSEGSFVMLRPKANGKDAIDESTDTYDSIAWLIKSLPDNN